MITFKTTIEKPIYDKRQKPIGDYIVYITVQKLELDINNVIAKGFYYYKTVENDLEIVNKLNDFNTILPWYNVSQIEAYILSPLNVTTLKDAVLQRVVEFTLLQIQQEDGQNYNIKYTELVQE